MRSLNFAKPSPRLGSPSAGSSAPVRRCLLDLYEQIADHDPCVNALVELVTVQPALIDTVSDSAAAEMRLQAALREDLASDSPIRVGMWVRAIVQLLELGGKEDEAEQLFREALTHAGRLRSEDLLEISEHFARHLERRERETEANEIRCRGRVAALRARGKGPSSLESLRGIAFELFKAGDYSAAEAIYRHLLSHDFEPTGSGVHLARCLLTAGGRHSEAEAQARLALAQRQGAETYQVARALYLVALINTLTGRDAAEHLIELAPLLRNPAAQVGFTVTQMLAALQSQLTEASFVFFTRLSVLLNGQSLGNAMDTPVREAARRAAQDPQGGDPDLLSPAQQRAASRSLTQGIAHRESGRLEESRHVLETLAEQERRRGRSRFQEHCCAMSQLGRTLRLMVGRAPEARDLHWRVLAMRAQVCGRQHQFTINSANILAETLRILNEEALAVAVECWAQDPDNASAAIDEHLRRSMGEIGDSIGEFIQDYLNRGAGR